MELRGKPVVLLFDEFQLITYSDENALRDEFFETLKVIRDEKTKYNFQSCLAFGTYSSIYYSSDQKPKPKSILPSPFDMSKKVFLSPPKNELMSKVLTEYMSNRQPVSSSILKDIIHISGGHLGLFGTCGLVLDELMTTLPTITEKIWKTEGHQRVLKSIKTRRPFQDIVEKISQLNLMYYLKSKDLLYPERSDQSFVLNNDESLRQLIDIGVLRPYEEEEDTYFWTSPFLHDFVVNLCTDYKVNIPLADYSDHNLAVINILKTAIHNIDVKGYMKYPPEAAFQAELYGITKAILSSFTKYHCLIEGHPTVNSRQRYDILIRNQEKWVIELKVNWNSRTAKQRAVSQVRKYAKLLDATRAAVVNFSDGRKLEQIDYDEYEIDAMDLEIDVETQGILFLDVVFSPGFLKMEKIDEVDVTTYV